MFANLTGWHLLAVLAIVLLLFGASRLPALSKSIAQSMRSFRRELDGAEPASAEPAITEPAETEGR